MQHMSFLNKLFGDTNARYIKKELRPIADVINSLEGGLQKKSDDELRSVTAELKAELANGKTLGQILPRAFAVVREAARRTIGQRHYDVQLIGAMVLHHGQIAEMRTGEGKTLTATAALYLNALTGRGAHLVTVNDYLARRDAVWMGKIYNFLGLTVGGIQHEKSYLYDNTVIARRSPEATDEAIPAGNNGIATPRQGGARDVNQEGTVVKIDYDHLRPVERREAYAADITYGTNNEFGFDYLRDNMAPDMNHAVQRPLHYAIVDEVDSILIDEARTPLIISGPDDRPTDMYFKYAELVRPLKENEDYNVDEKLRSSTLSEAGIKKMEAALGMSNIYTEGGLEMVHHLEQALKADTLFKRDKDYVVQNGEVIIVDEFTGRLMHGRRYSEGLHQAIEAKENVEIKRESRTMATITFQNLFRLYKKLSGMTGTAATEGEEFSKIYNLDVVVVPTNKDMVRHDGADRVYKNAAGKYAAVVEEVRERSQRGQPMLLGTISIDQNEHLSALLTKAGVKHEILNAKNHEREAEIISQAGRRGAVTLATNMAGRGVDIILGGNPPDAAEAAAVRAVGGLHVLGTERHESRRIDNQLRGRAGRQGDPGSTQFFVCMEDDLMRIFGSDRLKNMMTRLGVPDDMPIENKLVSKSIESAQTRVEGHNFDIRKHLVEYDDVINRHREAIYRRRRQILEDMAETSGEQDLRGQILEMLEKEISQVVNFHTMATNHQDWNVKEIEQTMATILPPLPEGGSGGVGGRQGFNLRAILEPADERDKGDDAKMRTKFIDHLVGVARQAYEEVMNGVGPAEQIKRLERAILLYAIDARWVDHLQAIDHLRTAIGLRGYGQRDPLVEYKREAYRLFQQLLASIQNEVVYSIFKAAMARQVADSPLVRQMLAGLSGGGLRFSAPAKTMQAQNESPVESSQSSGTGYIGGGATSTMQIERKKVGRNEPCPCGSGKKFKKCHGG